ncbi:hypothetical protein ACLQ3C_00945 [Gordonia sp. DT30]|uniref:hypothetical protein n=1 Tax=Gordonia sp. DT30 TaxID=3416546 RepID=UPI003CE6D37A
MIRTVLGAAIAATAIALLPATASAAPGAPVDPVSTLIRAGTPPEVAAAANSAQRVAGAHPVNIANPGRGFPGGTVDAVVDTGRHDVTVIQRWLDEPSRLQIAWVNVANGRSGVTGLPNRVTEPDPVLGTRVDRTATLPTGAGSTLVVVWGRVPGWTGLIPAAPEYFGYLAPHAVIVGA